jgi:hypothetical protein
MLDTSRPGHRKLQEIGYKGGTEFPHDKRSFRILNTSSEPADEGLE